MTNQEIAKLLRNIAASYAIKNESKFRFQIIAYQKAADSIENSNSELEQLHKENKLDILPGIGPSIKSHLEELFRTGKVRHFEWVQKDIPKSVFTLLDVPTFGPKKAFRLVKEFSLNDPRTVLNDLEKIGKEGKISILEGFGEKSQEDILTAIREYKAGKEKKSRMVLPYAQEIADSMVSYLKKLDEVVEAYPLGSLRRMTATIGDIDIAVATNFPKKVIDYFVSQPNAERVVEKGQTTASILTFGGKQVDLMTQPPDSFGSLLQHLTGNKDHNVALREYSLKKGLSLSEYGIKRKMANGKWQMANFDTEEKFYKALGMDWIPPEIRENKGEIELAIAHKLPKLIEIQDVKGDLHIHSSYPIEPSHDLGHDSMEEMLKKAKELGYDYLAFSEHNPSVSKHSKKDVYSILAKRKDMIEQLNSTTKDVRAINLLEVDILSSGQLSIDKKSIDLLEAMIVSIHSAFSSDKNEMTKRVIEGLSHPKAKIFAHPTGRLLNQRAGYQLDWEKLFEFCKNNNKALEINGWTNRLDLPDSIVREAVRQKIKMVVSTDSHKAIQMNLMKYAVSVARRGWAQKDDIINTFSYNEFINWLRR